MKCLKKALAWRAVPHMSRGKQTMPVPRHAAGDRDENEHGHDASSTNLNLEQINS
jgi:hypothetical protein